MILILFRLFHQIINFFFFENRRNSVISFIYLNFLNEIKENGDDESKIKKLEKSIEYDNTNNP